MVEQVEHPGRQRLEVGDDQADHHPAVVPVRSTTASAPSSATTRDASAASTATSTSTASPDPELPRVAAERPVHVEPLGQLRRTRLPHLRQSVDPVHPEGPGLPPVAVRPTSVPVAPTEPDAGHVHRAEAAPVVEPDDSPAADGVEQDRQGREPVDRAAGRPGATAPRGGDSPPIPSLDRASRPIGSPRWTPATARFKRRLLLGLQTRGRAGSTRRGPPGSRAAPRRRSDSTRTGTPSSRRSRLSRSKA